MNDNELRRETERMLALREGVEQELRRIFGVIGVGVGVRERAGQATPELAFRVYTRRKRPRVELARSELLPARIRNYAVDVHTIGSGIQECCGATNPLLGGLGLSAMPVTGMKIEGGTLGCFLALPDGTEVALSNEHVLNSKGGGDARVFQPAHRIVCETECNAIGLSLQALGHDGDFTFNGQKHYIDCAVVDLEKIDFVNKLVKHDNSRDGEETVTIPGVSGSVKRNGAGEVTEILDGSGAVVDATKILGSAAALPGTLIFKVGSTTGLTVGRVTDVAATVTLHREGVAFEAPNQIVVAPVAGYRPAPTREAFSNSGDSGSVYLNLENRVVGLHHHGTLRGNPEVSYGSNIAPVLRRLGNQQASATVLSNDSGSTHQTAAPSTELARSLWVDAPAAAHRLDVFERSLRDHLSRSAQGLELLRFVEKHVPEVLRLVWNRRAVTVVWHRHHGPAYVVLFARALTQPAGTFPGEAGGVTRRAMLAAMADVLGAHGSPSLRTELAEVRPWLLDILSECRNVPELCARLGELAA